MQRYKAPEGFWNIRTRSFRFLFLLMRQQSDPLSRKKCLQYNVEAVDGTLKRENGAFRI